MSIEGTVSELSTQEDLELYAYDLPPHLIAQVPEPERHTSRLLVLNRAVESLQHLHFSDLPGLLKPDDLIVLNNTEVIPARLDAVRSSGGNIRLLLLRSEPTAPALWHAMGTPIRRLKPGEGLTLVGKDQNFEVTVKDLTTDLAGQKRLLLDFGSAENVVKVLRNIGQAPLPPYIERDGEAVLTARDLSNYQTVYAKVPGAVAAPTAGLHFSPAILEALKKQGNQIVEITLHVGPGTFKPIADSVADHKIESESFAISLESARLINEAKAKGRRIVAVGTTSCRALETAGSTGKVIPTENGSTDLYIRPGFSFQIVDALITNFHLSKSSLLVLVSAFSGRQKILAAYREAIAREYRFFSYGDAMLIV